VNWWVTWPAEQVNGFMVSDRYRRARKEKDPFLTYPASLMDELPKVGLTSRSFEVEKEKFGLPQRLNTGLTTESKLANNYKTYWGHDKAIRESCLRLLAGKDVEVFAAIFRIVDVSSHLFWNFLNPDLLHQKDIRRSDEAFSKILEPVYVYVDQILGDFLKLSDENTHMIVCSDHGFQFVDHKYDHNGMKVPPDGILILNGPAFKRNVQIQGATLLDITPTLLYLMNVPVGRDMDGKVLLNAFRLDLPPVYIASHDQSGMPKTTPINELDEEAKEDFRALGYLQ